MEAVSGEGRWKTGELMVVPMVVPEIVHLLKKMEVEGDFWGLVTMAATPIVTSYLYGTLDYA